MGVFFAEALRGVFWLVVWLVEVRERVLLQAEGATSRYGERNNWVVDEDWPEVGGRGSRLMWWEVEEGW